MIYADRTKDSTITTGSGSFALSGTAPTGYKTFAAAFTVGATGIAYVITNGAEWEIGEGTLSASTTLTRDTIHSSSNANSPVNFSAGTKDIFCSVPADALTQFTANLVIQSPVVTGGLTTAADTVALVQSGAVKQITLDNFVTAISVAPSSLTAASALSGSDVVVISQGGDEVKTTLSAIAAYVSSTLGVAPGTVTSLAASSPSSSTITLSWAAGTGGSATSWTVTQRTPSGSGTYVASAGTFTGSGGTVTGLSASTAYDFQVVAANTNGSSAAATLTNTSTTAPAATAPAQVTGLTRGTATSTTQPLTWTAPSNGGSAITDYVVQWAVAGSGTWNTFADGISTTASATVTGLTASTSYDYRVAAVNAIGTGTNSATSTGSTASAGTTYTITEYYAGVVPATVSASAWAVYSGNKYHGAFNQYWNISPTPASVMSGWSTSSTVPPVVGATRGVGDGLIAMTHPGAWSDETNCWGAVGAGTITVYLWIKPVDGVAQCMNPSGMIITGL